MHTYIYLYLYLFIPLSITHHLSLTFTYLKGNMHVNSHAAHLPSLPLYRPFLPVGHKPAIWLLCSIWNTLTSSENIIISVMYCDHITAALYLRGLYVKCRSSKSHFLTRTLPCRSRCCSRWFCCFLCWAVSINAVITTPGVQLYVISFSVIESLLPSLRALRIKTFIFSIVITMQEQVISFKRWFQLRGLSILLCVILFKTGLLSPSSIIHLPFLKKKKKKDLIFCLICSYSTFYSLENQLEKKKERSKPHTYSLFGIKMDISFVTLRSNGYTSDGLYQKFRGLGSRQGI